MLKMSFCLGGRHVLKSEKSEMLHFWFSAFSTRLFFQIFEFIMDSPPTSFPFPATPSTSNRLPIPLWHQSSVIPNQSCILRSDTAKTFESPMTTNQFHIYCLIISKTRNAARHLPDSPPTFRNTQRTVFVHVSMPHIWNIITQSRNIQIIDLKYGECILCRPVDL